MCECICICVYVYIPSIIIYPVSLYTQYHYIPSIIHNLCVYTQYHSDFCKPLLCTPTPLHPHTPTPPHPITPLTHTPHTHLWCSISQCVLGHHLLTQTCPCAKVNELPYTSSTKPHLGVYLGVCVGVYMGVYAGVLNSRGHACTPPPSPHITFPPHHLPPHITSPPPPTTHTHSLTHIPHWQA